MDAWKRSDETHIMLCMILFILGMFIGYFIGRA